MELTKKIQIGNDIYIAHTSYKVALRCNQIAEDETINDYERALGIICTVFGKDGLNNPNHYEKLLLWVQDYLSCGKQIDDIANDERDFDYQEDFDYIVTSFQSDYGINLDEQDMDWHRFYNLLNGLSNSEFGNCCVLNRIRNLRTFDASTIKDNKERQKIINSQKMVELKKYKKENHLTKEQEESMENLNRLLGI